MHLDAQNGVEYTLAVQRSARKGSFTKQQAQLLQEAQLNDVPMQFYRRTPAETNARGGLRYGRHKPASHERHAQDSRWRSHSSASRYDRRERGPGRRDDAFGAGHQHAQGRAEKPLCGLRQRSRRRPSQIIANIWLQAAMAATAVVAAEAWPRP
jgi:hypothetical protein